MISWFPFLCLVNKMIKLVLLISITSIFDCSLVSMKTAFSRNSHPKVFLGKGVSENMQQIYRRTSMPKCDFNKVAKQLNWNHFWAWVFSCKFAAYFQNTFSKKHLRVAASEFRCCIFLKVSIFLISFISIAGLSLLHIGGLLVTGTEVASWTAKSVNSKLISETEDNRILYNQQRTECISLFVKI